MKPLSPSLITVRWPLFAIILFFVLSSPLSAKSGCATIPAAPYNGPEYYITSDDKSSKTNACPAPSHEREIAELKNAKVTCIDNPTLIAKQIDFDRKYLSQFSPLLSGSGRIEFVSYDSFGIKSSSLRDIGSPEYTAKLAKAVSLPDYFDASLSDALCVYANKTDRQACAEYLNNQLPAQRKENLLASGGWWQFANTQKSQFEAKKRRAAEIVACADGTEDPLTACDQPYLVNQTTGLTSLDLARKIIAMDYPAFQAETPAMQMTILSLRESRAYSATYLVVRKKNSSNSNIIITLLDANSSTPKTVVQTNYIPGVYKTTARATELYQLLNTKAAGDAGLNRINQQLATEFTYDSHQPFPDQIRDLLTQKIDAANLDCANQPQVYQSAGSQEDYPQQSAGSLFNININFNLPSLASAPDRIDNLFEAYLVAPTEIIAQTMAQDEQGVLPMMFKQQHQQSAQQATYIPQELSKDRVSVSRTQNIIIDIPCRPGVTPDDEGRCHHVEPRTINYFAERNTEGPLPGGEATNVKLYLGSKLAWKVASPPHYSSTCYANELAGKVNTGLLSSTNQSLFNLLGRTSAPTTTNCPQDFIASNTNSGTYGQCSAAQVRDNKDAAINAAAAKYSIPPSLLQAIYSIEAFAGIIVETGNYQCAENFAGAAGPFQIVKTTYDTITCPNEQITNDIGLCSSPGSDQLSRCDVYDAAELSARILLSKVGKWSGCSGGGGLSTSNPNEIYQAAWRYYGSETPDYLTIELGNSLGIDNANYGDCVCAKMGISCPH